MTSAAAIEPASRQRSSVAPAAARGEEAGGEQVAGAGRVDDLGRPARPATSTALRRSTATAPAAPRVMTNVADLERQLGDAIVEVAAAGEVPHLVLVAEQDVDRAPLDHPHHALAAAGDAQALGQSESDRPARRVGDPAASSIAARGRSGPHR